MITVLFVAQSVLYRFAEFGGLSQVLAHNVLFYAPVVQPIPVFLLDVLIFTVAALRIISLSRWLSARASAAE